MKYNWIDLPERKNCFTVRDASMINLNTGKIVRSYTANTKIAVVQKCVTTEGTYYRTSEAAHHYLNYAFKASAFGLPDEKAPSAHSSKTNSSHVFHTKESTTRILKFSPVKKQTSSQKAVLPKDGEVKRPRNWLKNIFRRKNGKAKNS